MLLLHAPDGTALHVYSFGIVFRPAPKADHVVKGTGSIVWTMTGKGFGVHETDEEIAKMIRDCK